NTAAVVRHFVDEAHRRGIAVALDVNYRSLLWGPEHAREVLEPIARMSNIVFCSVRDGKAVFGIESDGEQAYGQRTSAYALTHYGDLTRVSPSELNIPPNTDILR
ncbi:2-keto-3-deoxygluconate kinase, partial [Acinetobacter baumannii]